MKRIMCLLCAVLLLCCGCSGNANKEPVTGPPGSDDLRPYYREEAVPVVVPLVTRLENGDVQMTIHGGLLMNGESDVLTEEQKADGFLTAVRNEDQSVTYTIAGDRYEAFLKKHQQSCRDAIIEGGDSGAFESVYKVEINEDFTFAKGIAETAGYSGVDAAEAAFQTGLYAIRAQAFDINAAGTCTVSIVDETSGE
ncbi:MAG: hypothetical protein IJC52_02895, partial [Clostridia bacterium]|nr:hypothetical protein [Clostridia bacterium]